MKKGQQTQTQMGIISNLITDMNVFGAPDEEMARAVKHSMVVIDAAKHELNYKQSEKDNDIAGLKRKYQGHINKDGEYHEGAATIISRAKSKQEVLKRKGSPWIDPETGLNLGRPSTAVIDAYGGADALVARLNTINQGASIYNPAGVTTMQLTDYAVENASFLRVNNITVGYTFPKAWAKKVFAEKVRVYFTGYNLFCLTSYSGADPEVDTSSKKNAMTPGIDYAAYPKSRTFVGGINVSF